MGRLVVAIALCSSFGATAAEPIPIPYVPAVTIDGDLAEWDESRPVVAWSDKACIVHGEVNWGGLADLGGAGWLGWDSKNLYLAVRIDDDVHKQTQTGRQMWKGDHFMALIDAEREKDREQTAYNGDDFQITFSPGSLKPEADWLFQIAPEAYVHQPQYVSAAGITLAATKRPGGYDMEAAVPWHFLSVQPSPGHLIGFDLCPSDCDSDSAVLETLASLVPGPWRIGSTERMLDGILVGGEGVEPAEEPSAKTEASEEARPAGILRAAPPKPVPPPAGVSILPGGAIAFVAGGADRAILSEYSIPGGSWLRLGAETAPGWEKLEGSGDRQLGAQAGGFRLQRRLHPLDECLEVRDTITNLTDDPLPVMTRHFVSWPSKEVAGLTLGGSDYPLRCGRSQNPAHPTMLLTLQGGSGFGMAAVDDASRVHGMTYYLDEKAGLADGSLTLAPGATHEQAWQVYVLPQGDYWGFVNTVRRTWESNFPIFGPFCFINPRRGDGFLAMTVPEMREWLEKRNVDYPDIMSYHSVDGRALHGLSRKLEGPYRDDLQALAVKIRDARSSARVSHYWHCFLTGSDAAHETDPADAVLNDVGEQVFYSGNKAFPVFFPTLSNRYGRQMWEQMQAMVKLLGLDGIYWDEQERSFADYHYGEPWDSLSGVIDPDTHELVRKRSSLAIISAPFRHKIMQWLADEGLYLICNSPPILTSTARFKVPRFTETGSIVNLYSTHLFSPIGLGDHRTERTHADVMKGQREFLMHGALYYYYSARIPVGNPGLLRWMYPITPVAIGPGYVLGEDRILTARGGLFSWGEKRLGEIGVHVIDPLGSEVPADYEIVAEKEREWLRLILPQDHAAAILKKCGGAAGAPQERMRSAEHMIDTVPTNANEAEAGDITVACYYFPNYHVDPRNEVQHGPGWSEWELVKAATPRWPGHDQPKAPAWGYTDEADPACMARKIAAAADHGIDAFIFDWYYYDDGPFLARGLEQGFWGAENRDRLKFGVMWANHDWMDIHPAKRRVEPTVLYPGRIQPETWDRMTTLLAETYFRHPSYWMVEGKPYFSLYDLTSLLAGFGSIEAARAGLDAFRAKCTAAGLPGLHLNAVVWGRAILPGETAPTDPARVVEALGFDSVTSYVWIHHVALERFPQTDYDEVMRKYLAFAEGHAEAMGVPYFPNITMGWDSSPRTVQSDVFDGRRYPFMATIGGNTPERFETACRAVRDWVEARPAGPRIVTVNCWNEWTEGSYLEPDEKHGLAYLEALRRTFRPGTSE